MILSYKDGNNGKVHIYIDGEYRATVDGDFWYSEGYRHKKEINEEELTELLSEVGFRRAYNKALDLLSRRPHGAFELQKKLRERDFSEEEAGRAVERLEELGLINDEQFAVLLASELYERKGYSAKRIQQELIFRGIDRQISQNAVESIDINAQNRIILLVRKKYLSKLQDEKGRRRTVDALLRLGYSYGDIKSALEEIEREEDF